MCVRYLHILPVTRESGQHVHQENMEDIFFNNEKINKSI